MQETSLLISTKTSEPDTDTWGDTDRCAQPGEHGLYATGKETDLALSGVGHSCVSWHFTRAVDTFVPILQAGKRRQQLLSNSSKVFQLLDQSNHFLLFKASLSHS